MAGSRYLVLFKTMFIECFPKLTLVYRFLIDSLYLMKTPQKTPMGFKLTGNRSMEEGTFESAEVEIVKKYLREADVFINIGANIGYYCCIALSYSKPTIAFEPISSNLKFLYKNIKANGWENNIEIFPLALSNRAGLIEIFGGGTGASLIKGWAGTPEKYVRLVPSSTINNVIGSRFHGERCLILVDIEGAEKSMLEGAKSLLEQEPRPVWIVEISILEHQPEGKRVNTDLMDTFQIFWDHGYEALTAGNKVRQVNWGELKLIFEGGRDTLGTHNFIFVEKGRKEEGLLR